MGDISVCINNMRYRNEQEYQFFASPIKPFMLRYYDFKWVDQLRKEAGDGNIFDIINQYRQGNSTIKSEIPNLSSFDRSEASNMIMFYKQMVVSTRTLQLNDYIVTNHKILDELRNEYNLK